MEPVVLMKHKHGATAQWLDASANMYIVATYVPVGTKYALQQVQGPWDSTDRLQALGEAHAVLDELNGGPLSSFPPDFKVTA